jgi:flavin reductase (DIM6/NTAB) family NADH-FMN oxidoreductase RutF
VLICVDHTSESHGLIARSGVFAVNILREGQSSLSASLSNKATAELAATHSLNEVGHASGTTGSPILDEGLAYADCRVINSIEAGDHTIYVGRVEDAGTNTTVSPLVYFRGQYTGLASNE